MQIHELKPKYKLKSKKRIGRGGKRGTYSGKGMKGQKARAGTGGTSITEKGRSSWVKRFPKFNGSKSVYLDNIIVKTEDIEKNFKDGEKVTPDTLLKKGLISKPKKGKSKKKQLIKILLNKPISKKVNISGCLISKTAEKTITKAGGEVKDKPVKKLSQKKKKYQE